MRWLKTILFILLATPRIQAAIQYPGGTIVNATFTGDTRQHIVDGVSAELLTAGWTCIGTCTAGTASMVLQSASTPDTRQIQVNLIEPGSGNCAQVKMRNVAGTKVSQAYFLLPAALKTFRVIASKYQFFVFTPGASAAREYVGMGVPFLPTFLQSGGSAITGDNGWIQGNSISDVSAVVVQSFRTKLGCALNGQTWSSLLINNSLLDVNTNTNVTGAQSLIGPSFSALAAAFVNSGYRWFDSSLQVSDALIAGSVVSATSEALIFGQLYGGIVVTDSFVADTTISFDTHTFFAITNGNAGTGGTELRGTLFIAVN